MTALLHQDIETRIRQRIADIHMLPTIATQGPQRCQRPDCTIANFSKIVERDVKLAADIRPWPTRR